MAHLPVAFCHWQRTNRRRLLKERLHILLTKPGDPIPRWRDHAIDTRWDDYADTNKKRRLKLYTERIVDVGESFTFVKRELGRRYLHTMEGQIALEYASVDAQQKMSLPTGGVTVSVM